MDTARWVGPLTARIAGFPLYAIGRRRAGRTARNAAAAADGDRLVGPLVACDLVVVGATESRRQLAGLCCPLWQLSTMLSSVALHSFIQCSSCWIMYSVPEVSESQHPG